MAEKQKYKWPPAISLEAARARLLAAGWVRQMDTDTYINRHQQVKMSLQEWDSTQEFRVESPTQIEIWPTDMLETALITFDQKWPDA